MKCIRWREGVWEFGEISQAFQSITWWRPSEIGNVPKLTTNKNQITVFLHFEKTDTFLLRLNIHIQATQI
jgi:hypothetical protein